MSRSCPSCESHGDICRADSGAWHHLPGCTSPSGGGPPWSATEASADSGSPVPCDHTQVTPSGRRLDTRGSERIHGPLERSVTDSETARAYNRGPDVVRPLPAHPAGAGVGDYHDPRLSTHLQSAISTAHPQIQTGDLHGAFYFPTRPSGHLTDERAAAATADRKSEGEGPRREEARKRGHAGRGGRSLTTAAERRVSLRLTASAEGNSLVLAPTSSHPIAITSASGRWVLSRPITGDAFIEVRAMSDVRVEPTKG